ncbi:MAG: molybdopterin molybdotransferase MoeA [Actinobacteria bacterium]|nr:molybdopterin molybdotransferase MoeA [Actinomycetota bacterium]
MDDALRTVEEHLAEILAAVQPLEHRVLHLADAHGFVLGEPVLAHVDLPLFDNSAMDGFAVRFADVSSTGEPITLRVVADLPAGTDLDPPLDAGEAARIMTGSPVPSDADAIVPFEHTTGGLADSLGDIQVVTAPTAIGAHIRRQGTDCRAGDVVLARGVLLGPRQLAAAAAVGVAHVTVSRRPRIAVISTGSELREPGEDLARGQIPESNSILISALVAESGGDVVLRASVPDDDELLRAVLEEAAELGADAVITSGGVSAGAYEVVKSVAPMRFVKVAMQPGKPQGFGAGAPLLFGLPGNPVSVAVSFETFVRPALLAMQGRTDLHRRVLRLPAAVGWRTPPARRQYLPVTIESGQVRPATSGGSHLAAGLARAEAYAVIPAGVEAVAAGDIVDVMLVS